MLLEVSEGQFDGLGAETVQRLGLRCFHPRSQLVQQLLMLEARHRAAFFWTRRAGRGQRAAATMLRRTTKPEGSEALIALSGHPALALQFQWMSLRAGVGLVLIVPSEGGLGQLRKLIALRFALQLSAKVVFTDGRIQRDPVQRAHSQLQNGGIGRVR